MEAKRSLDQSELAREEAVAGVGGQLRTLQDTSDGQRLRLESLEKVRVWR